MPFLLACLAAAALRLAGAQSPWAPAFSAQAAAIVAQLSLAQKVALLHGHSILDIPYVGNVPATVLKNASLPPLHLEDGPSGVADAVSLVTAFPNAGTVLMSWDRSLYAAYGDAMGAEFHAKGANIALAPAVNLVRVPWSGRAWEYAGEDPVLASAYAHAFVPALQRHNLSGCVKHAFLNAQEQNRNSVSENAAPDVLQELYYPPFRAAVDAGVGYAMCSYNRINGAYACENNGTLLDLKAGMGFAGAVLSDWYATHSAAPAALAGLDQEMPGGFYFSAALQAAVAAGALPLARLDDMARRVLTPVLALGLAADPPSAARNILANASSAAHSALARELAQASLVLLKNERGALPLAPGALRSLAVFGDQDTVSGHGSGSVSLPYVVTPAAGLAAALAALGSSAVVTYHPQTLPLAAAAAAAAAADAAIVVLATTSSEGADRPDLELPAAQNALAAALAAAQPRTIAIVRAPGACTLPWLDALPAVLFEGMAGQESGASLAAALLGARSPAGKLALTFPASVNDTWLSSAPGGAVDPARWPGTQRGRGFPEVDYGEGQLMGYRYYEALAAAGAAEAAAAGGQQQPQPRPPLYVFGHGLSYAAFVFSPANVTNGGVLSARNASSSVTLSLRLALAPGSAGGAEVVQVYAAPVAPGAGAGQPVRRLLDFSKVELAAGAAGEAGLEVRFAVTAAQLARYDAASGGWRVPLGTFRLDVGSSSADTRSSVALRVEA